MFVNKVLFVFFLCGNTLYNCSDDDEWIIYESKYKNINREEIFISNATVNSNFKSNYTVETWKTITVGRTCYTGGITNDLNLVILFSNVSEDGLDKIITPKVFNLNVAALDFEFFHRRKNGKDKIFLIVYVPGDREFIWYTLDYYFLNKVWNFSLDRNVSHFSLFKMGSKNLFFTVTTNNQGNYSADMYEFTIEPLNRWFYQSIPLFSPANTSCLNIIDSVFYLSIPQNPLNQLQIYQSSHSLFTPYQNISSPNIDQVVCFENGFKSFIAFNGLDAGIYEFTEDGLRKETIVNSNLEGIQFWLPIPINTYRDETILLCQRKLNHDTHFSFEIDVITYNGNRFEEHDDIPCFLYGEQQSGLKCLTEYDHITGILGCSFIAIEGQLSLIIPIRNNTSLIFDLNVGFKAVEHPAKREFDQYIDLKNMLQTLIEKQNKEHDLLIEEHKRISEDKTIFEKKFQQDTADSMLKAKPSEISQPKIFELRDKIEQVVRDIENLNLKVGNGSKYKQNKEKFRKITFNGPVEIKGELLSENVYTMLLGGEETDYLLQDIVRKDQLKPIEGHKTFTDLTTENINFDNVNGILSKSFVSQNSHVVQVDGDLIFKMHTNTTNIIATSNLVNGVNINDEWISVDQESKGPLEFDQLNARNTFNTKILIGEVNSQDPSMSNEFDDAIQHESIVIPGNVTVENLNGHNFENFLKKLCLTSLECQIPKLKVTGVISSRGSARIKYLNELKFPQEYVALESNEEILTLTGFKEFTNTIRGYKITTKNAVNNINLNKIITRSDEQKVSGKIAFDNLEVASVLQVDGEVQGPGIDKFVPNIGLKETQVIKSNVYFSNLEVQGQIIIENDFNGINVNEYFNDFVFKGEENVEISGNKTFPQGFTALKNFHIDSNMINDISLNSLITKNSTQDLNISIISGTIDFDHLYVNGNFDGQDIIKLNKTLVRLSENQTVKGKLVFLEQLNVENLAVENLVDLNGEKNSNTNKSILSNTTDTVLDTLEVDVLEVKGNIIGTIENFDLKKLQNDYLSYTKEQIVSKPFFVHKLSADYVTPRKINNIESYRFSYQKFKDNITDFLLYRNPYVKNLKVEEDLSIKTINDKDFNQVVHNDVWMKMYQNESLRSLTIDGDVYFQTLQIQSLGSADFNEYVDTLIFKNETNVDIENTIVFENGIKVEKLIETETLNDVLLENILRKDGNQTLLGPIEILGIVTIEDELRVEEMVNNVDVRYISNNLFMDYNSTTVKGEVMFNRLAYIRNLMVNGTINGKDFDKMKSQFLYCNGDIDLQQDTYFKELVSISGNFGIVNDINGIILSDFVENVAWISRDTNVYGPIIFKRSVECLKSMNVNKELNTQNLFGKNLEEHLKNGVFVNQGLLKGIFDFDYMVINDNLNTQFINNLDMNNIIPLKSDQEIETLEFKEVSIFHDVFVGGKVNDVQLMEELKRTALINVPQAIESEVVFLNNVLIEDNLLTPKINNKKTSKIVTTNTDQNLTATYHFNAKCWTDGDLTVYGLFNGINFTSWKNHAVSKDLEKSQKIEKQWTVMNDLNLVGPVSGDGIMNGINITQLINDVKETETYKCNIEKGIFEDYKNICNDVTYIYKNAKNQIYKFKYFEELQRISLPGFVHLLKHFEHRGIHYLLVNEEQSCLSHLMELQQNAFYFIKQVHTGIIKQIEVAKDRDDTFLVTRGEVGSKSTCKISFSSVVWKFTNHDLQVVDSFENQELLQDSQIPLTFYGVRFGVVTEFKIDKFSEISVKRYRKWNVTEDNVAFFPRGFETGLALRTGSHIIFLDQSDPIVEEDFGLDTEATLQGTLRTTRNSIVPGRVGGDVAVTNVGKKQAQKSLLAVAIHKKAAVEHRMDIIEIYQNPIAGELFDYIPTYRPTSLTSIEFENGESLLAFMEEQKVLQIYEYKGIEGFKHRSSIRMPAHQLVLMELPIGKNLHLRKVLGLVYNNEITLLQAIMVGNKIQDDLKCTL